VRELASNALERLCAWPWPGNVRALRHACERAVILAAQDEYRFEDFGLAMPAPVAELPVRAAPAMHGAEGGDGEFRLGALERETIAAALDKAKGNISLAARMLGLSRAALYRKLGKHGI
jgi:DNA-binding NtrC family response regulator